eukprot:g9324.t1
MPSAELLATLADMPAKEYLKHFCLDYYLSEALQCDSTDKLQDFWQDVLDGSHLKSKAYDFKRVMATAENRRSFVLFQTQTRLGWTLELRTRLKLVTSKPEVLAVTVLDFYDMLVLLLPDFPLDLLVDAADLAMPDAAKFRVLGQQMPSAEPTVGASLAAALYAGEILLLGYFVGWKVFELLREHYTAGPADSCSRMVLVKLLRDKLCSLHAWPSEGALQSFLGALPAAAKDDLTLKQALRAMARDFEMVPPPIPESLLKALRGELM